MHFAQDESLIYEDQGFEIQTDLKDKADSERQDEPKKGRFQVSLSLA